MARVVIDANVIISAAYGGKPLEAVVKAFKHHQVFFSATIIRELEGVAAKLSKKFSSEQMRYVEEIVHKLISLGNLVEVKVRVALSRDAKDDHYLSLCKGIEADFLITGDKDLLSLNPDDLRKNEILCSIVTPKSFLEDFS